MELNIWYDGYKETVIELNADETEGLWVSLSLENDEEISQEEKERKIQEAFDERFNKPDYNNWHKLRRHTGLSKSQYTEDREMSGTDAEDVLIREVMDDSLFYTGMPEWEIREEYEEVCSWIRKVLVKKLEWADAFIAVYLDGEAVRDYSERTGSSENNVSQKLRRAKKKLKESWRNRQIQASPEANK